MKQRTILTIPQEVIIHTKLLLKKIRSHTKSYIVSVNGLRVLVYPNVFPPTTESRLMGQYIHVSEGDRVLDLTTGSGVGALIAGLQGAHGVAVDINPNAVKNAEKNFSAFNVKMTAVQSDLFLDVPPGQFDLILCNPPYYEGNATDILEQSIYGGRNFIQRMFVGLQGRLTTSGKALVTYAEWANDYSFLEKIAMENGFTIAVIGKKSSRDKTRIYRLYEIRDKRHF